MSQDLVERVLAAIAKSELGTATVESSAESSYDVLWSVVTRVQGDRLRIKGSSDPSPFDALAHGKVAEVLLDGQRSTSEIASLLRRVALRMSLPPDARAVPLSLLVGGSAEEPGRTHVCAAALPAPTEIIGVLCGRDRQADLQAIVFGQDELAVVGLDGYSDKLGRIVTRAPLSDVTRADLDARGLGLSLAGKEHRWSLGEPTAPLDGDLDAIRAALERARVPTRRLVRVSEHESRWEQP